MYYAVDTSSETVHAFRTRSYRNSYVISNYEGKAITPNEARAIMLGSLIEHLVIVI